MGTHILETAESELLSKIVNVHFFLLLALSRAMKLQLSMSLTSVGLFFLIGNVKASIGCLEYVNNMDRSWYPVVTLLSNGWTGPYEQGDAELVANKGQHDEKIVFKGHHKGKESFPFIMPVPLKTLHIRGTTKDSGNLRVLVNGRPALWQGNEDFVVEGDYHGEHSEGG